ncbi:MAG: phosphate ABC transporter substrate-binding protein [Acidobacteriota bacterium]
MLRRGFLLIVGIALLALPASALRINGSTTVNPVVVRAAEILQAEQGLKILVDTQGGSSGGIAALGDGRVEIGMSSRPLSAKDRERFPGTRFQPVPIGYDAVALAVSRDVWEGGLRTLTRQQVRGLYEGTIRNWREIGGPDRRVAFFNKEPGRGTWEVFADWLYGDADRAPLVSLPEVGSNEEGRNKVRSTRGAITQISVAWTDQRSLFAVPLIADDGTAVEPSRDHLEAGSYPLSRPLLVITNGDPRGEARLMVDFLLSPRGQGLVEESGYLSLGDLAR